MLARNRKFADSPLEGRGSHLTLRWREMDSNFQYAGAVNLVVGPFGWIVLCDRVRVRARRFWDSAVSATRLGDLSCRRRGGPPHRSIDEGSAPGWPARWPQIDG